MGKFISRGKVFFPLNISETVEGSFGNPAFKFSAKRLKKVFADSPKVKKEMNENFEKCFSQVRSFWNMGFVSDNPADFFRKKAHNFYGLTSVIVKPRFQTGVPSKTSFWVGEMHKWTSC